MRTIDFAHQKEGTGKTTLAVASAWTDGPGI
jgi:cellulose biosynthesis protein BcsQ